MVGSNQIDIGWASPPFGLKEFEAAISACSRAAAKCRPPRNQTVSVQIVNADTLKNRKDVIEHEGLPSSSRVDVLKPAGSKNVCQKKKLPVPLIAKALPQSHPRSSMPMEQLSEVDSIMADAVANKFVEKPMTKEQQAEFYPNRDLGK